MGVTPRERCDEKRLLPATTRAFLSLISRIKALHFAHFVQKPERYPARSRQNHKSSEGHVHGDQNPHHRRNI